MSLTDTPCRNNYIGNGSVATYAFTFKILKATELAVFVKPVVGDEVQLDLGVDFTVVFTPVGGTITLIAGNLTNNYLMTIRRNRAIDQSSSIRNQTAFFADVHENAWDALAMENQQQQEELNRSLKFAETEDPADFNTNYPFGMKDPANAGRTLVINDTSDGMAFGPNAVDLQAALDAATAAEAAAVTATTQAGIATEAAVQSTESAADAAANAELVASLVMDPLEVSTAGGNVAQNLPLAGVGKQFVVLINSTFTGVNTVDVSPQGGDTLMGGVVPDHLGPGEIGIYWSNGVSKWYRLN